MDRKEIEALAKLRVTDDGDAVLSITKRDLNAVIHDKCETCAAIAGIVVASMAWAVILAAATHGCH